MMKPSKFRSIKTVVDGISFDSRKEARRYGELQLLQAAGEISDLELQPRFKFEVNGRPVKIRSDGFPNGRQAGYTADFRYWSTHRQMWVIEDVKSPATATEADKLRRALVEAQFGIIVETV